MSLFTISYIAFFPGTGADFTSASQTLTFGPADVMLNVTIPITNDNVLEGIESFTARISSPTLDGSVDITSPVATIRILSDEGQSFDSLYIQFLSF